jgi:hypothetical protein
VWDVQNMKVFPTPHTPQRQMLQVGRAAHRTGSPTPRSEATIKPLTTFSLRLFTLLAKSDRSFSNFYLEFAGDRFFVNSIQNLGAKLTPRQEQPTFYHAA